MAAAGASTQELLGSSTHLAKFASTAKVDKQATYQKSYHRTGLLVEAPTLAQDLPENVEILSAMKDDLRNKMQHLIRSNEELQEALLHDPDDQEFKEAISENKVIIERSQATLHNIDIALEKIARVADVGYFTPLGFAQPHVRNGSTAADHRQAEIKAAEAARQAKSRERMKSLRTASRHSSERRANSALPPVPKSQQEGEGQPPPPETPPRNGAAQDDAGVGEVAADGSILL